jgi:hypothetical protein
VYIIYVCLRKVVSNTYCVVLCCVLLGLVYPMMPVSLDCLERNEKRKISVGVI